MARRVSLILPKSNSKHFLDGQSTRIKGSLALLQSQLWLALEGLQYPAFNLILKVLISLIIILFSFDQVADCF